MTTTLRADRYFHIGESHMRSGIPCQDYSVAEAPGQAAFAIVTDGCSGGKETDIGARLVALAAANALREEISFPGCLSPEASAAFVKDHQGSVIEKARRLLGLHDDDLLSTSLHAYADSRHAYVLVQGDGFVAIRLKNGNTIVHRFEWDDNMPFYPAYRNGRLDRFIEAHGSDIDAKRLTEECLMRDANGNWKPFFETRRHSLGSGIDGIQIGIGPELYGETEFIALFTDGISQISDVPWEKAIEEFLAFRHTKGEFVKRRVMRGLGELRKRGAIPYDDIACAILRKEQRTENGEAS